MRDFTYVRIGFELAMIDGKFNPYTGPVRNQAGEVVVPEGAVLDDGGLWGMTYFVEGVTGTMPE